MASNKIMSIAELNKMLGEKFNAYFEPDKIKTDIVPLDLALNGYLETGNLIELSGESGTGKSTLLLHLSKNLCEKGYNVCYIDTEGSVKLDQIKGLKLSKWLSTADNPDNRFTLVKCSGYNEVEDLISKLLESEKKFTLFVIDSLTALTGDVYLDLSEERLSTEARVGFDAQQNSRFLKKLSALKVKYNCTFIFINQTRVVMNSYGMSSYQASGGQAVKFFPDVRLFMKLKDKLKEKTDVPTGEQEIPIGANTTIEAHKSRLGLGFIPYPMTVYFGKGISNLAAYQNILPSIKVEVDGKEVPILEKQSSVTYVIHLPEGDVKTTSGQKGVLELIVQNADSIKKVVDDYLETFFGSLHDKEIQEDNVTVEESDSGIDYDDSLEEETE